MIYGDFNPWHKTNPNTIPKIPDVPVVPPLPDPGPESQYAFQCGECGILVPKGAWGYCCPNQRCPIQMRAF